MSRFYLIVCFSFVFGVFFSQSNLKNYLKFAEEKSNAGDFFYALELYEKALEIDSNSLEVLWHYAETLRAYKDYRKAEVFYAKVYERESGNIYPMSLINLGLMQKHNEKYASALETFKKAKKKFSKDKNSYPYIKAKREMESCLWVQTALRDTLGLEAFQLPETINTKDAEFGHAIRDGAFIFSSLRADSIEPNEAVYDKQYRTALYRSRLAGSVFKSPERIEGLLQEKLNTGNGSFSLDGKRFYFSLCKNERANYACKIMVANYKDGIWSNSDSLGSIINSSGSTMTMPSIGELNGKEVLFFSSDRSGSLGGLDIWYTEITNGNQYGKPRNVKWINSIENELSPWWDSVNKRLYFSSSWFDGFGGYDVFSSDYTTLFSSPKNVGLPINSSANDLYFFKYRDTCYFSSNRLGVFYSKNPTCCSDIFGVAPVVARTPPTKTETLVDLNKRLPVTLYFHNDYPDPKSTDTVTRVSYLETYTDYQALLEKYQVEYSSGLSGEKADDAREDIENFFTEYVVQGMKDLDLFLSLLLVELKKGAKIRLTVKGFASPLAKTAYNVNLTKRRISSLVNYLMYVNQGVFAPYLQHSAQNGGQLIVSQIPFGEYNSSKLTSDNIHDQRNSIYSRKAAIERKIELQSVDYYAEDSLSFIAQLSTGIIDFGGVYYKGTFEKTVSLANTSLKELKIMRVEVSDSCLEVTVPNDLIKPKTSIELGIKNKQPFPVGLFSIRVRVFMEHFKEPIEFMVTGDGQLAK